MSDKTDNYFASVYLAALGDKIGFGNGYRERNYSTVLTVENNPNFA
jgi:hypothetical protein